MQTKGIDEMREQYNKPTKTTSRDLGRFRQVSTLNIINFMI